VHVWPHNPRLTVAAAGATAHSTYRLFGCDKKLGLVRGLPCGSGELRPELEPSSAEHFDGQSDTGSGNGTTARMNEALRLDGASS